MLNAPLNEKTSFLVSARRTYADVLATPYLMHVEKDKGHDKYRTGYYFYDLNAKINHKFNDKHRIYLSAYTGKDKYHHLKKESGEEVKFDDVAVEEFPHLDTIRWSSTADDEMWWSNVTAAFVLPNFNKNLLHNVFCHSLRIYDGHRKPYQRNKVFLK